MNIGIYPAKTIQNLDPEFSIDAETPAQKRYRAHGWMNDNFRRSRISFKLNWYSSSVNSPLHVPVFSLFMHHCIIILIPVSGRNIKPKQSSSILHFADATRQQSFSIQLSSSAANKHFVWKFKGRPPNPFLWNIIFLFKQIIILCEDSIPFFNQMELS